VSPGTAVSVVIATCNRAENLQRCLEALVASDLPGVPWEIIVVDNGSTDSTRGVVRAFGDDGRAPVQYLFEQHRGKSIALNCGVRKARGQLLAFTDDDCIVTKRWLGSVLDEFAKDPLLAVLGGRVELYDPMAQPISLVRFTERLDIPRDDPSVLVGRVIGANMTVRRDVVKVIGGFDCAIGPGVGGRALGGEDVDFVYRAWRAGLKVTYSPACLVMHNHGRYTDAAMKAVVRSYNRGIGAFYGRFLMAWDKAAARMTYWTLRTQVFKICSWAIRPSERAWRVTSTRDLLAGLFSAPMRYGGSIWRRNVCCGLCPLAVNDSDDAATARKCSRFRRLSIILHPLP